MQPAVNIAVRAARRAGEIIVRSMNRLEGIQVTSKGRNDFASEVDRAAEQEIIAIISRAYPQHAFLAEESGRSGDSETVWIIDPLDGTTNFLHGFPTFAVSIACEFIRNPPSPVTDTTFCSGFASRAAKPPGTAMPILAKLLEIRQLPGEYTGKLRPIHILWAPTSEITISSSANWSCKTRSTPGTVIESPGFNS